MMSEQEIHDICKKYKITNYIINPDGSIDVNGDIDLKLLHLYELPLKFNKVNGHFDISHNIITSLEGSPKIVTSWFDCSYNILTSLKGGPKTIGMGFDCSYNKLTSLKGGPVINENYYYYCLMESLISLEGYKGDYDKLNCYNKSNLVKKHKRSKTLKLLKEFHL